MAAEADEGEADEDDSSDGENKSGLNPKKKIKTAVYVPKELDSKEIDDKDAPLTAQKGSLAIRAALTAGEFEKPLEDKAPKLKKALGVALQFLQKATIAEEPSQESSKVARNIYIDELKQGVTLAQAWFGLDTLLQDSEKNEKYSCTSYLTKHPQALKAPVSMHLICKSYMVSKSSNVIKLTDEETLLQVRTQWPRMLGALLHLRTT